MTLHAHPVAETQAEPQLLATFRAMSDLDRHRVLQLLIREFACAEDEADLFLSRAAAELIPGDDMTEEQAEQVRDDFYPASPTMAASRRHRIDLESRLLDFEDALAKWGKIAIAGTGFYGSKFGG